MLPAGLDHYVAQAAGKSTTVVEGLAAYPAFRTPPVLYEFEACPYCRFVREAVTALDLVVDVKPCGRGSRHRAEARKVGGKEQFPLLVDGDTVLYESADIVDYLAAKRGVTPSRIQMYQTKMADAMSVAAEHAGPERPRREAPAADAHGVPGRALRRDEHEGAVPRHVRGDDEVVSAEEAAARRRRRRRARPRALLKR